MSIKNLSRIEILEKVKKKELTQGEASQQQQGAGGLASKRHGKASNNRLADEVKKEAMEIIKTHYKDFGPTLAHEKLMERHGLKLSRESVRKLMVQEGFWKRKSRRKRTVHQQRMRRSRWGELVQIDGSPHDWFEGRREKCC